MDFEKAHKAARARAQQPEVVSSSEEKLVFETVSQAERSLASSRTSNRVLAWALWALVILVPVAVGGNRPTVWMASLFVISLLFIAHTIVMWVGDERRPPVMLQKPWLFGGALLFVGYVFLQALPLPGVLGIERALGQNFASGYISQDADASWIAALRLSGYVLFFYLVQEVSRNSQRVIQLLYAVAFGVFLHAVWGLAALVMLGDFVLWAEKDSYSGFATGTFVNRNSYATFLAMGGSVLVALLFRQIGRDSGSFFWRLVRPETVIMIVALSIVFLALLASASRMGLVAFLVGCMVSAVLMAGKLGFARRGSMLIAGAVVLLSVALLGPMIVERSIYVSNDLDLRFELYRQVLSMISENPVFGVGADAFAGAFENYHQPGLSADVIWHLTHSSYLANWVEMGIIFGSLPLLLGLGLAGWLLIRVLRRDSFYTAPVAALGALCAGAVHSLLDFSLEMQGNTLLLLFLLALAAVSLEVRKK